MEDGHKRAWKIMENHYHCSVFTLCM